MTYFTNLRRITRLEHAVIKKTANIKKILNLIKRVSEFIHLYQASIL